MSLLFVGWAATAVAADTGIAPGEPTDTGTSDTTGTTSSTAASTATGLAGEAGGFGCASVPGAAWMAVLVLPAVRRSRKRPGGS